MALTLILCWLGVPAGQGREGPGVGGGEGQELPDLHPGHQQGSAYYY